MAMAERPAFESRPFVCHTETRRTNWVMFENAHAVDVALSGESVHVLFAPSYLVTVPRQAGGEPKRVELAEDRTWSTLDVAPADGPLWLARENSSQLLQVDSEGTPRPVPLIGVSGEGGFREIQAQFPLCRAGLCR